LPADKNDRMVHSAGAAEEPCAHAVEDGPDARTKAEINIKNNLNTELLKKVWNFFILDSPPILYKINYKHLKNKKHEISTD